MLGADVGLDEDRTWSEVVSCPATAAEPFTEAAVEQTWDAREVMLKIQP